ncbi:DUF484 family protein [Psychrobium sp. 1_MG-2023]|uniref:DUF484 family protein n=1 Tax=Psychrobium sp. 1_MG-2023 TaxID=3062624 RepID=UPI000C32D456|nr:DUF484 family protein [Psychrobium sp. 1_MG-2023]MDP2562007.1 DUF484 family protein [Psychrobium sp. 1_MG-2023]PKF58613.1 DUF484 domain-containing protein [Alteromonadales bacterium alter-6D02]
MSTIQELSDLLDESIVAEYLEQHPDFFQRHQQLLSKLSLPSAQQGAISLVERQQQLMRTKINSLEDEITSLMSIAAQNQALYQTFAKLFFELLQCSNVIELKHTLSQYFNEQLSLSPTTLFLYSTEAPTELAIRRNELENLLVQRLGRANHYFGRINQQEQQLLFKQPIIGSVALIALGKHGEQGLLAIASDDPHHFHPEADNLMLSQLCRLISSLIQRML